jgi:hypothetical protein
MRAFATWPRAASRDDAPSLQLAPTAAARRRGDARALALIALWSCAMLVAEVWVWRYETAPGTSAHVPRVLPAEIGIRNVEGRATIVMLAHPHCPCTRASIGELAVLMTRLGDRATAHVFFDVPTGVRAGWEHTDLWNRAAELPGVYVHADPGGAVAARLGAMVSGHTVVYDAHDRLIFSGGITLARGHAGDNPGRRRIESLIERGTTDRADSPVFGCVL